MKIDFIQTPGCLITLTFPQVYEADPSGQYALLVAFNERLKTLCASDYIGLLWRKEYQARGAPHYHCLLFLKQALPRHLVREYVRREWTKLVGDGLTKGRWVRTKVDELRIDAQKGAGALYRYLSSYVAKADQGKLLDKETGELLLTGRMWGTFGELPLVEGFRVQCTFESYKQFCRRLRRWGRRKRYLAGFNVSRGWTLIYCSESTARQLLRGLDAGDTESSRAPPIS